MDIVSWTFGNSDYDRNRKIYLDPYNPEQSITTNEARCMVKKLVSGFKAAGLRRGDCVCIHAFNDVSSPHAQETFLLVSPESFLPSHLYRCVWRLIWVDHL